jgi:beta-glucosidase
MRYAFILLVFASVLLTNCSPKQSTPPLPYQDTTLPLEARVNDLVSRMTLEEKISQMMHNAPAIDRLGVPRYNWWSEALHGVARAGLATVFPQAIGLGATWDEELLFNVSTSISDEARAKHHAFASKDKRFIYQGLTLWSPNINLFRDPRWGRGQETYGEDPHLTASLAVNFIKGLQGDDSTYLKTIATVKHYAVHSGPEPERHSFDAITTEEELRAMYLPHFEKAIREGKPYSVMCAYNRYNGEPCCSNKHLLRDILREEWNFDGFIVSDCEAIADIYKYHKSVSTAAEAASIAVKTGTDLECGDTFQHLHEAIEKGLITETEIEVAVKRLFMARFKLGMFDDASKVKYANIPYQVVNSEKHQQLALEAARKSMVLLKNENNLLPLKKDLGTLAVIGPNANQWLMLLGNYNGVPEKAITPLQGIQDKVSTQTRVLYAQGSELAEGMPMFYTVPSEVLSTAHQQPGVSVSYFNNITFSGTPVATEITSTLDANWYDQAPHKSLDDDQFSVRWETNLTPTQTGVYQLGIISTCQTKLSVNDSIVAQTKYHFRDEYPDPRLTKTNTITLEAGKTYKIVVESIETYADAQVQFVWAAPKPNLLQEAIETAKQADAIVLCVGLTPRMEGEEMDVNISGFRGGDRTTLDLPASQQQLIQALYALKKPIVLVLLNGSALSINWENKHIPAIVEAWYPGQAAGQALADVLFGDYNPAGRLPLTFYKSVNQLPSFEDYHISNQTYRYFEGQPLYPFGYGLSYTTFQYDNLETTRTESTIQIEATVKNSGRIAGDEVVQVYATLKDHRQKNVRSLIGFKRIHLEAGAAEKVTFSWEPPANYKGDIHLSIGGGQPDTGLTTTSNVLKNKLTFR